MTTVSTPTGVNSTAQLGNTVIAGVTNIGITAGETLLFADMPFLAFPGLKQLIELLISFLSGYVVRGLQTVVTFTVIDVQIGEENTAYGQAVTALKAAQASGDANAIAQALKNFEVAAQNLGHSDGSGSV